MKYQAFLPMFLLVLAISPMIQGQIEFPGPDDRGMSPEDSLAAIEVPSGFRVELAAAEPLIEDPVAIAWDASMRLWVVEMRDYPTGIGAEGGPGSRIKVLEDTDGDWVYDTATLFLDGLSMAKGVMPWKNGAIITCAPEIFYAEDTTGDGKADLIEPLYTGFSPGNPQHRVNGPRWGIDNWIYCANGDSGGHIVSVKTGDELPIRGRDLRIRPETGALEGATGQTQFGRVRDDWGTWFGCTNWTMGWQYILEDHYIQRNPYLTTPPVKQDFTEDTAVFSISPLQRRLNDFHMVNILTSGCGMEIYRDTLLGEALRGNAFTCEPVHNLVTRLVLEADNVVYAGHRAPGEEAAEFFASKDNWSRPVFARTGPDGALWIVDMYRYGIEHPDYVNEADAKRINFFAGTELGRIYRILPESGTAYAPQDFTAMDSPALVAALDTPNGEQRDLIHQLLLDRTDDSIIPFLAALLEESGKPEAKVHALGILSGLGKLTPEHVVAGLHDPHQGVQRQALRMGETLLHKNPALGNAMAQLVGATEPFVVQQLAYSLGAWHDAASAAPLGNLLATHLDAPYIQASILSSLNAANFPAMLGPLLAAAQSLDAASSQQQDILRMTVRYALHHESTDAIDTLLTAAFEVDSDGAVWPAMILAEAWDANVAEGAPLDAAFARVDADGSHRAALVEQATLASQDTANPPDSRAQWLRLHLRPGANWEYDCAALATMVSPREAEVVYSAALEALFRRGGITAVEPLLDQWATLSPTLRQRVFDGVSAGPDGTRALLSRLESGAIGPREIDLPRRQRLLGHNDESIRARAETVFAQMSQSTRAEALATFNDALHLEGDATTGRVIFEERCATCHALGGSGYVVGPDLAAVTDKSPQALLAAIIDPNAVVEEKYLAYEVTTVDWLQLSGLLKEETASSITLRAAGGEEHTLLRGDIEEFAASSLSLMPEGLEEGLDAQAMADLIAYVADHRLSPKTFPGNTPETVTAQEDGTLLCHATNAGIYGSSLVFQDEFNSLGQWASEDDHATWTLTPQKPGKYRVEMEFCCDRLTAGNTYLLEVNGQQLTGKVHSTGTWHQYETIKIGAVDLPDTPTQLSFRAFGPIEGTLIELRALKFVPVAE